MGLSNSEDEIKYHEEPSAIEVRVQCIELSPDQVEKRAVLKGLMGVLPSHESAVTDAFRGIVRLQANTEISGPRDGEVLPGYKLVIATVKGETCLVAHPERSGLVYSLADGKTWMNLPHAIARLTVEDLKQNSYLKQVQKKTAEGCGFLGLRRQRGESAIKTGVGPFYTLILGETNDRVLVANNWYGTTAELKLPNRLIVVLPRRSPRLVRWLAQVQGKEVPQVETTLSGIYKGVVDKSTYDSVVAFPDTVESYAKRIISALTGVNYKKLNVFDKNDSTAHAFFIETLIAKVRSQQAMDEMWRIRALGDTQREYDASIADLFPPFSSPWILGKLLGL